MKTIELVVSPKGETKLETKGFSGDSCHEATAFLEAALGAKQSDQATAEAFAAVAEPTLHHSS